MEKKGKEKKEERNEGKGRKMRKNALPSRMLESEGKQVRGG